MSLAIYLRISTFGITAFLLQVTIFEILNSWMTLEIFSGWLALEIPSGWLTLEISSVRWHWKFQLWDDIGNYSECGMTLEILNSWLTLEISSGWLTLEISSCWLTLEIQSGWLILEIPCGFWQYTFLNVWLTFEIVEISKIGECDDLHMYTHWFDCYVWWNLRYVNLKCLFPEHEMTFWAENSCVCLDICSRRFNENFMSLQWRIYEFSVGHTKNEKVTNSWTNFKNWKIIYMHTLTFVKCEHLSDFDKDYLLTYLLIVSSLLNCSTCYWRRSPAR